jgi:hypothetical protein
MDVAEVITDVFQVIQQQLTVGDCGEQFFSEN